MFYAIFSLLLWRNKQMSKSKLVLLPAHLEMCSGGLHGWFVYGDDSVSETFDSKMTAAFCVRDALDLGKISDVEVSPLIAQIASSSLPDSRRDVLSVPIGLEEFIQAIINGDFKETLSFGFGEECIDPETDKRFH